MLQKTSEKLMRMYVDQKTVVGRSVEKQLKIVATRFVRMEICIGRAILKCLLREISELDYCIE